MEEMHTGMLRGPEGIARLVEESNVHQQVLIRLRISAICA
jgi:hypothetical protein